ncbi:MAG: NADH-quinone oxidoreductase subunit NuoE [Treponema sp.]|jgi:NADH-quinone oxidoreductase subunit E|nr:NADH-quinone oxidoreductase subunit NuoE [Treponema sp.]
MVCNTPSVVQAEAKELVGTIGSSQEYTIPLLQEIQRRHSYLPRDLVEAVSKETGIALSHFFGVATFYSQFRFKAQGTYVIRVCHGTACHVAGADLISTLITRELGIEAGETTQDGRFSFEKVACLGCCALAPVLMIGEKIYAKLSSSTIKALIKEYTGGKA